MSAVVLSGVAAALESARAVLQTQQTWPDPATGLASRLFAQSGIPKPAFMSGPLKGTSAALMRRTPELAAFGYVIDRCDDAISGAWIEGLEHLRGREIYPADRQSFIFHPVEILGVATGLNMCSRASDDQRGWFTNTILRGLNMGQFRTPLSKLTARAALGIVAPGTASQVGESLELGSLANADLLLTAGIRMLCGQGIGVDQHAIETVLVQRLCSDRIVVSDAAEAATLYILARRITDAVSLASPEVSPADRIVSLCRRFPLFIERLQRRQRGRAAFVIADEYDVQDLLHAVLKLHFDDVRPEEYTPSYGGNASRVDFYLPRERIIVEAKMTRPTLGQKEVTDELIIDAARYAQMEGVDILICLVYDPDRRCSNPQTIENDIGKSRGRLTVRAIVCPRGL